MNTTLYRSLALLISMFALTSSFSFSSDVDHLEGSHNGMTRKVSNIYEKEEPWIVEIVKLKDTASTDYFVIRKEMPPEQSKQDFRAFYDEIMDYKNIKKFINEILKGKVDSIFRVSRLNSQSVTVGVISKNNDSNAYKLHLFYASFCNQDWIDAWVLNKINDTFFAHKKMEVAKDGTLKLYFNGEPNKIIELTTTFDNFGFIKSCGECLVDNTTNDSNNNRSDMRSHIIFGVVFLLLSSLLCMHSTSTGGSQERNLYKSSRLPSPGNCFRISELQKGKGFMFRCFPFDPSPA